VAAQGSVTSSVPTNVTIAGAPAVCRRIPAPTPSTYAQSAPIHAFMPATVPQRVAPTISSSSVPGQAAPARSTYFQPAATSLLIGPAMVSQTMAPPALHPTAAESGQKLGVGFGTKCDQRLRSFFGKAPKEQGCGLAADATRKAWGRKK